MQVNKKQVFDIILENMRLLQYIFKCLPMKEGTMELLHNNIINLAQLHDQDS